MDNKKKPSEKEPRCYATAPCPGSFCANWGKCCGYGRSLTSCYRYKHRPSFREDNNEE